jgi:hypothetical protein
MRYDHSRTQLLQGRHAKKQIGFPQSMMKVTYEISDFRREADENCALMGFYTANSGNSLQTFRNNLSIPSSRVKNQRSKQLGFFTFEDGTNSSSRNVGKELPLHSQNSAVFFFR